MFAIIKRNWIKNRPLYWAGLFMFEFIVVLLGVLVAQTLQERFEKRREAERFEVTRAVLDEQVVNAHNGLLARGLQARCIRSNLATIRQAVADRDGRDLSAIAAHPPHPPTSITVWDSATAREARQYLTSQELQLYDYIARSGEEVTASRRMEEEWWASVLLAAQGAQTLTAAERTEVTLATLKLDHAFEGWDEGLGSMLGILWYLGLEADLDEIERMHQGDGVCAEEVRGYMPAMRQNVEALRQRERPDPEAEEAGEGAAG